MSEFPLPRPPEILEGFRIGALRRSAGALAVHAALDRLDLPVEVHVVRADALRGPFTAESFVTALRRAADVRHESLLPYVTGGRADDLLFAVAKTADAPGLDEVIARGGALAEDRVVSIAGAVCGVLAALERAGLRHGDLTPRRVLLPGRGQVALAPPRIVPRETAPGNDRYAAPEEARGGAGDIRSDLFVLGLILVEAASAAPLLRGSGADARRALAAAQVPAVPQTVPPSLRGLLARLLAADPAARFPTATAAEAAFAAAAGVTTAPIPSAFVASAAPAETAPVTPARNAPHGTDARDAGSVAKAVDAPAAERAPAGSPPAQVRRSPGRLYLEGRLGETMLEIDEDVFVGWPAGAIDVAARTESFAEAEFAVRRADDADVLTASVPVRVNGRPVESRALEAGDTIEGAKVRARYERATRAALKATGAAIGPPPNPLPARLVVAAALLVAIGGVIVSLPRFTSARDRADEAETAAREAEAAYARAKAAAPAAGPAAGDSAAAARENAAREAYEKAKDFQRRNPADAAAGRDRLREVAVRHAGTGHGAVARAEVSDADRRARGAGGGEFDKLLASAKTGAAEGRLDDALIALRSYAEGHPGTVAAERAWAAAVQLENEILGRFEGDSARVERALALKDWEAALRTLGQIGEYVPRSLKDRALALRRRAEAMRDGVDLPGETPKPPPPGGSAGETPKPPVGPGEPPVGPGEAPDGPGAGGGPPDRDRDAELAFRAAKKLMETGKDAEAIDAFLAFLRDHRETKPGARYDVEARSRITALAQGAAGITKLFRGKCEKLEKGRWRIRYDFEDAKQLDDFRDVEAFEAPPRAAWKVVDGAARAKGSGALVLDATFAIDQLVASVTVNPERAHDLGVAFLDASEQRRFYLYILQNTFFTLGRGDAAKVFEENAIVLFGPGMWRDTPPGQLGFVRKCGSPDPAVRPAESIPIRCGKSEGQVWMRFEGGKQMSGSAYGDIKLDFQGIEPGVFVMNSSGTFDEFVVEGTPDPEWVAKRWRAILSGL